MELLKNLEGLSADEQMTAVVELQKAAMKHLEMQKQASIGKSAELVIQGLKKIKSDFEERFNQLNGEIQTKVASLKDGEQGIQGPKGEKGDRGLDGAQGKDGLPGRDGKDGLDGRDGVGVQNAKIDFDGSLVITLTDGREINVGEVVPVDVAENIHKVTHSIQSGSGGDSQTVLDAISALQATIATYGTMAKQNANAVAITGGAIDNTTIGATTPNTGVFTTLTGNTTFQFGKLSANYGQGTGGATTKAVEFKALGSDTNVALALRSQGTGAIDLAAGSSGVNISNGGTVTNLTVVNTGGSYTTLPTVTISAPTTVGGVQATANPRLFATAATVQTGGTGYTLNDVVTIVGGTPVAASATFTVTGVSGGAITSLAPLNYGTYTAVPTNPVSITGGTGSSATLNASYGVVSFAITNAGSGYVEQPTVTFSGGGGSGAAAYATVGSGTTVRSLGASTELFVDTSTILHLRAKNTSGGNPTNTSAAFGLIPPQSNFGAPVMGFVSGPYFSWGGTGAMSFASNASNPAISGNSGSEQLRVAHTASAVNYVQVTGAATGGAPVVSSQGSDTAVALTLNAKGNSALSLQVNSTTQLLIGYGGIANRAYVYGSSTGSAVTYSVSGSDTNIDLALTTKGTGVVQFGTYTATVTAVAGYILIKDSGGTTRKLAVLT